VKKNPEFTSSPVVRSKEEQYPMKIVAIDATWLMHRAYHVRPVSVPYMVFNWICRFAVERKATHLVACFDSGRSFRHDIYDQYKSNRGEDSPVSAYRPALEALLTKANIGFILGGVHEADDLLATIGHSALMISIFGHDVKAELVTPDKDNLQCITQSCRVLRPGVSGNPDVLWDLAKLASEVHGFLPRQYLDWQTLIGDGVDTIPQIVTPGKAAKLILKHGSLKQYLESEESSNLVATYEKEIRRNRKLVKLLTNCFEFDPELYKVSEVKPGLDFRSEWYAHLTTKRKSLFS
jgi:DNA polymerase I